MRRDGQRFDTALTPQLDAEANRYMVGITVGYEYRPVPIFQALGQAFVWTFAMVKEMLVFLGGLFRGKEMCIRDRFRTLLGYTAMPLLHYALVGALGGLFSQVGDLTASTLKRSMGIKDFSHVLGNHGGIMDRADSIMLGSVALFVFYTVFY